MRTSQSVLTFQKCPEFSIRMSILGSNRQRIYDWINNLWIFSPHPACWGGQTSDWPVDQCWSYPRLDWTASESEKCQRSGEGQRTKAEKEPFRKELATSGPALAPGCHKPWSHLCFALTFHSGWEELVGTFSHECWSFYSDLMNNSKEAEPPTHLSARMFCFVTTIKVEWLMKSLTWTREL